MRGTGLVGRVLVPCGVGPWLIRPPKLYVALHRSRFRWTPDWQVTTRAAMNERAEGRAAERRGRSSQPRLDPARRGLLTWVVLASHRVGSIDQP